MSEVGAKAKAPIARTARKRRPAGRLVLMHLVRAMKHGLCFGRQDDRCAEVEVVVRIAANAMFANDRRVGRVPDVSRVLRWVRRKGLHITDNDAERIAIDEVQVGFLYTIEDRGEMLRITPDERIKHRVWMLGAYGQSKEERLAEIKTRQAHRYEDRLAKSRAATAAKRGPFHVNVSAIAREFGLSRPTVRALRDEWERAATVGENRTDFSSFCRDRIYQNTYSYNYIPLDRNEVCLVLGISKSTLYEWRKIEGKVEAELKAARPSKAAAALLRQKKKEMALTVNQLVGDAPDASVSSRSGLEFNVPDDDFDRMLDEAEQDWRRAADRAAAASAVDFKIRVYERVAQLLGNPPAGKDRRVA